MNNGNSNIIPEFSVAVDNFMKMTKSVKSKEDFLIRSNEFDRKFMDLLSSPGPTPPMSKSTSSQNQKQKVAPQNPFRHPT